MAGAGMAVGLLSGGVQAFGALAGSAEEKRKLEGEARMARMQADETDTTNRQDMLRQLSNIKAIRASAGMDTDSPTFNAVMDDERAVAGANRKRKVRGYDLQASQYEADASMVGRLGMLRALGGLVGGLAG